MERDQKVKRIAEIKSDHNLIIIKLNRTKQKKVDKKIKCKNKKLQTKSEQVYIKRYTKK